jgi:myotubularin-related protein 14
VCRSSTLSKKPESIWNNLKDGFKQEVFNFEQQRDADADLLSTFKIEQIYDLMVEFRKKKAGFALTSSEKARPGRFQDVSINSIPYPGCEFFKPFKANHRSAIGLVYDWKLDFVDASLKLDPEMQRRVEINWGDFERWDLIELTNNYLRYILASLARSNGSALIHCISGWDRTPLFRADGLAHENLGAEEFLYFTLAYDWMLFSHQLRDRAAKGEEILFVCFYALQFVEDDVECRAEEDSNLIPTFSEAERKQRLLQVLRISRFILFGTKYTR